ncbi:hypothetical protein Plhal304r1_c038g0114291 [Plasmopara halstedii]
MRSITSWKASRPACKILTRAAPDQGPSTTTIAVNATLPMNISFLLDLSFRCTALRYSFTRANSELADH